jgi:hypothetical protein
MKASFLLAFALCAPAAAFSTVGRAPSLARSALVSAHRIRASAEDGETATSEKPMAPVPATTPPPPPVTPAGLPAEPAGPALDIRLLPYVLVPLLVLASQLFLTFSRDTLPADMLGAADMTK